MNAYNNPTVSVYLHLETDEEFRERVLKTSKVMNGEIRRAVVGGVGHDLDDYVWRLCKMQRKLVWVTP